MLIQRGYKYRLYPTVEQKQQLLQQGGNARFVWNLFLKQNINYYEKTKKFIFRYELQALLPKLKQKYPFLKESIAQSLQTVAMQFDRALKDSFKEKGFPKFKKKSLLKDSFTCPQEWELNKKSVYIPKIGQVKWVKSRAMRGKPKFITIAQDGDKWFCSVLCEYKIKDKDKKNVNVIGIDVGLKEFATFSDGTIINNPKYTKKYEKKLAVAQRKLSKKKKGGENRFKQRLRLDFLHKLTSSMITKYDGFILENLTIKGLIQNKNLAKAVADVSWSEFSRQLEYKSKWNFKHFVKVSKFTPSSKICSNCGSIQDMPLNERQYNCPICNMSKDRDLNAALNLKNLIIIPSGRGNFKPVELEGCF